MESTTRSLNATHLHHHHDVHSSDRHHTKTIISFTSILIIIVSIITIVVFLAILVIIVMLRRMKYSKSYNSSSQETGSINYSSSRFQCHTTIDFNSSPDSAGGCFIGGNIRRAPPLIKFKGVQVFTYKELEVATDKFSEANVMGNGGFDVVYRGVLSDGTIAVIKKLHREGKQGERAFRVEVDLLSRLYSPYLVELLGYCADQHHRLLVFEYMPNGTLQNHLHHRNNEQPPLNWGIRLRIALDCAKALEFLHEHVIPPVIHRDFKCSNIFLDHNFRAKVSDFGLAKMGSDKINGQTQTSTHSGTTGNLAPEHASIGKLTTKSDVYSYGVVLLQLLTGRVSVDTNRPAGEHVLVSWALPRLTNREKVEKMLDPALKGQYSMKDLIQIAAIAAVCVQPEADYRPLMTDVVQSLIPLVKSQSWLSYSGSFKIHHQITSPKCWGESGSCVLSVNQEIPRITSTI